MSAPSSSLRRVLRDTRRSLTHAEQRAHARHLVRILRRELRFQRARRIGAYWAADGELDPIAVLKAAQARGTWVFLPILKQTFARRARHLRFGRYRPGQPLHPNRYGIPEPRSRGRDLVSPRRLDLLLIPLVGFDASCQRIGMGGGYYDRTLAYLNDGRRRWRRPHLIGVAHDCQRLPRILPQPWDVRLDAVATERRIYRRPTATADAGRAPDR
jgi:5-formyltetrahydrofolate cyclo-ligase